MFYLNNEIKIISSNIIDYVSYPIFVVSENGEIIAMNSKSSDFLSAFEIDPLCNFFEQLKEYFMGFNIPHNSEKKSQYVVDLDGIIKMYDVYIKQSYNVTENSEKAYVISITEMSNNKKFNITDDIYKTIFYTVDAVVVVTDRFGTIEMINPSFTRMTGYTEQEAIGQNPRILNSGYHPQEFFTDLWKTISSGKTWRGEFCDRVKSGRIIWEKSVITPIFDETGSIVNYVAIKENITKEKEEKDALLASSYMDFLTEVYNRRKLITEGELMLSRANCSDNSLYTMIIDIDNFKKVNDSYGHIFGDKVLKILAKTIKHSIRNGDLVARYGGEEFVVILYDATDENAISIAERIRQGILSLDIQTNDDIIINISVSIGLTVKHQQETQLLSLIERADKALYKAKENGKNRVEFVE